MEYFFPFEKNYFVPPEERFQESELLNKKIYIAKHTNEELKKKKPLFINSIKNSLLKNY